MNFTNLVGNLSSIALLQPNACVLVLILSCIFHHDSYISSSPSFRQLTGRSGYFDQVPGKLVKVHVDWVSNAYLRYLDFVL